MKEQHAIEYSAICQGVTTKIKISGPTPGACSRHIQKGKQFIGWAENPDQEKLEFEEKLEIGKIIEIRAASPVESGRGPYEFVIKTDCSHADRNRLFNLSQTGRSILAVRILPEAEKSKAGKPTEEPTPEQALNPDGTRKRQVRRKSLLKDR